MLAKVIDRQAHLAPSKGARICQSSVLVNPLTRHININVWLKLASVLHNDVCFFIHLNPCNFKEVKIGRFIKMSQCSISHGTSFCFLFEMLRDRFSFLIRLKKELIGTVITIVLKQHKLEIQSQPLIAGTNILEKTLHACSR